MTANATPGPAAGPRPPVSPGEPAPDFTLHTVHQEGMVSLASYRGKSPLLLAVFRGLWCPFCRRAIAELGTITDKLGALGVETLGVVATDVSNARLYFKHRPTRVPLAADPECAIHHAYGLPKVVMTPETMQALATTKVNPTGELPQPLPVIEAGAALDRLHGFQGSPTDQSDYQRQAGQFTGHFLVDREGIVRWTDVECASEGLPGIGKVPTNDTLLAVARTIA